MATTFIDYKDKKGFYISESFMQLAMFYISEELKKSQYTFINKTELLDTFDSIVNGYRKGFLVLSWNEELEGTTDEQMMIQVLQNLKTSLLNKGAMISLAELKSIPTDDPDFEILYSRNPFPTSELIKIIEALIQMLNGSWTSTNLYMDINYRL
jgi:light-regulated signal transduction histidine kinase (bacteriophytochrome)